jgi:DNA polymerase-3 subunit gamma/tau
LEVVEALLAHQPGSGLDAIHTALDAGSDPRQFARQMVDYLRSLLLVAAGNAAQVEANVETRVQLARHAQALPMPELLRVIQAFNQAAVELRSSWQPALALEMAFLEAISSPEAPAQPEVPAAPRSAAAGRPVADLRIPQVAETKPAAAVSLPTAQPAQPAASKLEPVGELSGEDITLNQRLTENWKKVIAALREQNSLLYGLINSVRSRHMQNGVLTLGFASEVLRGQVERPVNLELVQSIVSQVMGTPITIRCRVTTGKNSAPPPDVDNDGMVAAALRDLGGEIVDMQ